MAKDLHDMIGMRFGKLTVLKRGENRPTTKQCICVCQCDCGNTIEVFKNNLMRGHTKSCGCLKKNNGHRYELQDYQKIYKDNVNNLNVIGLQDDRLEFYCNNCKNTFTLFKHISNHKYLSCPICGDGISYPNKFLRNLITQLPVEKYQFEYKASWTQGKSYDAYFIYQDKEYVVEIDGQQHYRSTLFSTIEYQQENDLLKDILAEQVGCTMIRINAKYSFPDYIQEQIQQSLFNELFDLSQVDWDKCKIYSAKSIVINICNYFNEHVCSVRDIAKQFNIGVTSVYRYMQSGANLGLIASNYKDLLFEQRKNAISKVRTGQSFNAYDVETNTLLGVFNLLKECEEKLRRITNNNKINRKMISEVLHKKIKTYRGMTFSYV